MSQSQQLSRALQRDVARRHVLFQAWLEKTQPAWDARGTRIPLTPKDHRYNR